MKIEFNDDMKEIFEEFMVEAEEILETLDQELVELEENPEDRELLNKIFRGMHTLKGGAGFLGLESVIALAHKIETIFDKLRNDELKLDSNKMDIILEGIDILKNSIYSLKESHEIPDKDEISDILNNLDKIIEGKDNTQETTSEDRTNNKDEKQKYEESPLDIEEQTTQANPNTEKNKNNIEIIFKKDVDPKVQEIIKKYPGKDFKEILDELILLPPDERDMDLIEKIDNLISKGKDVDGLVAEVKETETKPEIKENKTEETNKNTQNEKNKETDRDRSKICVNRVK